jgi:uncharacterized protein (TIGR00255 family)
MITSMTGFGRAEATIGDRRIAAELSAVNNRFLEFQIRLPRSLIELEPKIKKLLSTKLHRGKINFSLSLDANQDITERLALDKQNADMYFRILNDIKARFNLQGDIRLEHFVNLPELISTESAPVDLNKLWAEIEPVCLSALESLYQARLAEGQYLLADLKNRLHSIAGMVHKIRLRSEANVDLYRNKLNSKIKELLADVAVDQQRLALEVALMAEKMDITEELIRLESHLQGFDHALQFDEPAGKRLTFILQEMHREANTIAAKSADHEISADVIEIKSELEKIREQVLNIE